jgi:hypothetical protein
MKRLFLLLLCLTASSCTESLVAPTADSSPPAVFEELWHEFDLRYSTFAERHINWDSLHARYASRVTNDMPDSNLLKLCDSLLAPLRDGHVALYSRNGGRSYGHSDSTRPFEPQLVSSYYLGETADRTSDGTIIFGRIHDSIGYMNVKTFDIKNDAEWGAEIDNVLASIWDTKALIVDLRANDGGTASAAQTLGARFIPVGQVVGYNQVRYDGDHSHFSAPDPILSNISHSPLWTKPIVLLTDRATMSAAEWITMGARTLPNVTIVGDTTQGAFSARLDRELSNGWRYSMSYLRCSDANHICHEGIGLIPDIEVYVRENRRVVSPDTVLDRALLYLSH